MRTTFRANEVLALFDKVGDAFKSSGEGKPGPAGEAIKQGLEELKEARAAAIMRGEAPEKPNPGTAARQETKNAASASQQAPAAAPAPAPAPAPKAPASADPKSPAAPAPAAHATPAAPAAPEAAKARDKGAALGDGSVLHGMGFAPADGTKQRNRTETENVARFLRDPGVAQDQFVPRAWKGVTTKDDATSAFVEIRGRRDKKVDERRAEDRREDVRQGAIADAKKGGEARENRDGREALRAERDLVAPEELRDKHGAAWTPERAEAELDPGNENALRLAESLGELHRCRGLLEDGNRCLRRPMLGIPYCREHAAASAVLTAPELPGEVELGDLEVDATNLPDLEGPPTDPQVAAYVVTD